MIPYSCFTQLKMVFFIIFDFRNKLVLTYKNNYKNVDNLVDLRNSPQQLTKVPFSQRRVKINFFT